MTTYLKVSLNDIAARSGRGGYILLVKLNVEKTIHVGSLGTILLSRAFYAYLGSALGGFKSRINRHLAKRRKPKWHIDYLLNEAEASLVILYETEQRLECLLSQALVDEFSFVPDFGSSDCRCQSHLYFADDSHTLELGIRKVIAQVASAWTIIKITDKVLEEERKVAYLNY